MKMNKRHRYKSTRLKNKKVIFLVIALSLIIMTGATIFAIGTYGTNTKNPPPSPLEIWQETYNGGGRDYAYGVAIDSNDNIIVTGYSRLGGDDDYYTIKYNSDGTETWNKSYDGTGYDVARSVAVDSNNNIIITGYSYNSTAGNNDYCTIKYQNTEFNIPEFSDILIPVIGMIFLFFIMRRKYKK